MQQLKINENTKLYFHPRTGMAGNMVAAALYNLCEKIYPNFSKEFNGIINKVKDIATIKIKNRIDGIWLDTELNTSKQTVKTFTYSEARKNLNEILDILNIKDEFKEFAKEILEQLITAENIAHSTILDNNNNRKNSRHEHHLKSDKMIGKENEKNLSKKLERKIIKGNDGPAVQISKKDILQIYPIGYVHSPYKTSAPYQVQVSNTSKDNEDKIENDKFWIDIDKRLEKGLKDLEYFTHIYLISYLNNSKKWSPSTESLNKLKIDNNILVAYPPWESPPKARGVFASRSPRRPNPIGLSIVKLKKIQNCRIYVEHLDLFNGTPILDIKPYLDSVDRIEANNGWVTNEAHLAMHKAGIIHSHSENHIHSHIDNNSDIYNNSHIDNNSDIYDHSHTSSHSHFHQHPHEDLNLEKQINGETNWGLAIKEGHLHEAADIIIDAALPAYFLQKLQISPKKCILIPPIFYGGGEVRGSHGILKIPAPATKVIQKKNNLPFAKGPYNFELTTPTGAAIAAALKFGDIEKQTLFEELEKQNNIILIGRGYGGKQKYGLNFLSIYLRNP